MARSRWSELKLRLVRLGTILGGGRSFQRKDAPRLALREFYVLCATLEVPSEALLHPQKLKLFGDPNRNTILSRKGTIISGITDAANVR